MNRKKKNFPFAAGELNTIKIRMLHWANQSNILIFLDSNEYLHTNGSYECICAAGAQSELMGDDGSLSVLKTQHNEEKDWLFGHVSYDFKNQLENLSSNHTDRIGFPELYFFRPEVVCYIPRGKCEVCIESLTLSPDLIWEEILAQETISKPVESLHFQKRITENDYLNIIARLRQHIADGDCYEINFCNEGFCEQVSIDPLSAFKKLNTLSKAPFAAYYKLRKQYLMCASPERYLRKEQQKIIAQPIKGTMRRSVDTMQDKQLKELLLASIKEKAENVMIVDLMRNDLARFCQPGSVTVDELFGIYTFPQVHQMISTVSGTLRDDLSLFDALQYSFPMGSMTGAPKLMVMQLIEQYEAAYRGLFSGTVGYITPDGDFDFNVVIRSLFYNQQSQYLNYQTGGAITYDSLPRQEWEETLLKAAALEKVFE